MTYSETIDWLFQQFPAYHLQGVSAYKPSLENIERLAAAFGNPQEELRFVHIAGTNGKGSTSNMLASILTESGERTGLFTSPHIHDFTERIRVNGATVSEEFVIRFCEQVRALDLNIEPSFFEITWLMALCFFREERCTLVVAETGLGGRLDATNIIMPLVSVITNISLDHVNILGNTRTEIAGEKAGIIKPGVPVVVGQYDAEILPVFERFATERNAPLIKVNHSLQALPEGIFGYQEINFATVHATIDQLNLLGFAISPELIEQGITHLRKNTGFYGRLEIVGRAPLTILDCAHNADGIRQTLRSVAAIQQGKLFIVYGTSADKELTEIAAVLPTDATYAFTTFSNPRSASQQQLQTAFGDTFDGMFFSSPEMALNAAKNAAGTTDTILLFGSFFLISEFYELFNA